MTAKNLFNPRYDITYTFAIFSDIASRGILDVVGDDAGGRKIILISACRFPSDRVNYDLN